MLHVGSLTYTSYRTRYSERFLDTSMGDVCLRKAEEVPERLALSDGKRQMTYGELRRYATSLAYSLKSIGIGTGDRVVVRLPKDIEAVAAILGVLLSGAAYVPVDAAIPEGRYAFILESARPKLIVARGELAAGEAAAGRPVFDLDAFKPYHVPRELVQSYYRPRPDHEAYVLFTSGSSGDPKGVRISHGGVTAFLRNVAPIMGCGPAMVAVNTSPLHYDVSIIDVFFPLSQGATVHLSPAVPFPNYTLGLIEKHRATHLCGVGSTLNLLVADPSFGKRDLSSLERIMTGAEVLNPHTLRALLDAAPKLQIINGYGPTEAACGVIGHLIGQDFDASTRDIPIGRAFDGVPIRVLEDGELAIGGPQVMLGYVDGNQSCFRTIDGQRYYLTGDIVEENAEGLLVFRGRKDRGVKIRGYRVHLEEVEAAFLKDNRVRGAAAFALNEGEKSEIVMALEGSVGEADLPALTEAAKAHLPGFMIPKTIMVMPSFPALASGKTDRGAIKAALAAVREQRP